MLFILLPRHQLSNIYWGSINSNETPHLCGGNKGLANTYCKPWWDSVGGVVPTPELADGCEGLALACLQKASTTGAENGE